MSDYTPTTGAILNGYVHYRETQGKSADYSTDEFHRWLAEHDRQVKAQAWQEGYTAGSQDGSIVGVGKTGNPYKGQP